MKYTGRFPLINIFLSRLFFAGVRWRLAFLRVKNHLLRFVLPPRAVLTHDVNATATFLNHKSLGFDKLNVGGGRKNLAGFVNVDFFRHPGVEREIVANILDLSFIPDGSVSHVHSNHVLEHLTQEQMLRQFAEYRRILGPLGLLTIRCPNALGVCYGFWFDAVPERGHEEFVALGFPPDENFFDPRDNWYHRDFYGFLHWLYGDAGNVENEHLQLLTPTGLRTSVESSGFSLLKATEPETSNIVIVARKTS